MTPLIMALTVSLGVSVIVAWMTIRLASRYRIGIDSGEDRVKSHIHSVPRLGAIPIFAGLGVAVGAMSLVRGAWERQAFILLLTLLPALGIGLLEDVRQSLGVPVRLLTTMVSAALAWWLLGARIDFLDIGLIDPWLAAWPAAAFAITLIAASGISHAINIIDGCNGLSSFVSTVILCAIAAIAHRVGDTFLTSIAVLGVASIIGFFVWNFPFGRLFLGDGGAYLSGMLIAELSILLVCRNPMVSPWFPLTLAIYPIWETVYSAWRRVFVRGRSPGSADQLHMHSLVYHRLVRSVESFSDARIQALQSSVSSMYMWVPMLASATLALLFWNDTMKLMWCCTFFALTYIAVYRGLVHFHLQRRLGIKISSASGETPSRFGSK